MTPHASRAIGELRHAGDWACADGDFGTLAEIAHQLAAYSHEPLHCELAALADVCRGSPSAAIAAWARIKQRVGV